jgi:hypothetical protein
MPKKKMTAHEIQQQMDAINDELPRPRQTPISAKKKPQTCTVYVVKQIMPAQGWMAVYYEHSAHTTAPIHALALAYPREYEEGVKRTLLKNKQEEDWQVVGLMCEMDDMGGRFQVCDNQIGYCGLIPPGKGLEDFEECYTCDHAER